MILTYWYWRIHCDILILTSDIDIWYWHIGIDILMSTQTPLEPALLNSDTAGWLAVWAVWLPGWRGGGGMVAVGTGGVVAVWPGWLPGWRGGGGMVAVDSCFRHSTGHLLAQPPNSLSYTDRTPLEQALFALIVNEQINDRTSPVCAWSQREHIDKHVNDWTCSVSALKTIK